MATTLILLGVVWLFYGMIVPMSARTAALSNALSLEQNLKVWIADKVGEGRLLESDVEEIFPENGSLRFGGENPKQNFQEMISSNATSSAPPVWPGVVSLFLGVVGVFSSVYKKGKSLPVQDFTAD